MPDGTSINYTYDPFGKRISKTVSGVTTYFLYDEGDIIAEYDATGNLTVKYIHGQNVDEPISMEREGNIYYYTFDGLGSISELTDSTGSVIQAYKYDSFGNIMSQTGTVNNPYTFTGREYDVESGLFYYRARYLDTSLGRFITPDPLEFREGVNFYVYAKNNPVNYVDPTGMFPCGTRRYKADPNRATIVCDGAGGIIKVQLGWCTTVGKCLKECCRVHETSHKNDCDNPNVCKGKQAGIQVYFPNGDDLYKSECKAYKADLKCTKSNLKKKECCDEKDSLKANKEDVMKQIKKYCK